MISTIQNFLPLIVVIFHIALGILLLSLLFHNSFGRGLVNWVGRHSLKLGALTTIIAVMGSLFYSNVVGFIPCDLCWWQRVFIYPQAVLFAVAVQKGVNDLWKYVVPLSFISAIISLYHLFVQMGGNSILPCSASASCDKLYVFAYGYVTIPTMSLTIAVAILLLAWARRVYNAR